MKREYIKALFALSRPEVGLIILIGSEEPFFEETNGPSIALQHRGVDEPSISSPPPQQKSSDGSSQAQATI